MVCLLGGGGEGDPEYIILLDTQNKQNYTIYEFPHYYINDLSSGGELVWYIGYFTTRMVPEEINVIR